MQNTGKHQWEAIKWIICYVKGSLDRCLVFDKSKTTTYDVAGFSDFDYGGDIDHSRFYGYISTLCVILSLGKHSHSPFQVYPLLRLNTSLQLRVLKKLHG